MQIKIPSKNTVYKENSSIPVTIKVNNILLLSRNSIEILKLPNCAQKYSSAVVWEVCEWFHGANSVIKYFEVGAHIYWVMRLWRGTIFSNQRTKKKSKPEHLHFNKL